MYPQPVEEIAERIYECIKEDLLPITSKSAEWCKNISIEEISKFMMPKFLNGDELLLAEKEVSQLFSMCITSLTVNSLKEKGYIDSILDENGEEIIFLTSTGKKVAEDMLGKNMEV